MPRAVVPGVVYLVLNRGNGRADLFHKPADRETFLRVPADSSARDPVDLFAYWRASAHRGRPLGDDGWVRRTAAALGLEHTLRGPGRP